MAGRLRQAASKAPTRCSEQRVPPLWPPNGNRAKAPPQPPRSRGGSGNREGGKVPKSAPQSDPTNYFASFTPGASGAPPGPVGWTAWPLTGAGWTPGPGPAFLGGTPRGPDRVDSGIRLLVSCPLWSGALGAAWTFLYSCWAFSPLERGAGSSTGGAQLLFRFSVNCNVLTAGTAF